LATVHAAQLPPGYTLAATVFHLPMADTWVPAPAKESTRVLSHSCRKARGTLNGDT